MAVDMFLKIDDIKGESVDEVHKEEIDVLSFAWGMTQSGSAHVSGGAGCGKVNVQNLVVSKLFDKSSPALMKLCCNGKHFTKALLTVRKAGGSPIEYIKIEMHNGIIAGIAPGGTGHDDRIGETLTLNFEAFNCIYTPQDDKGAAQGEVPAGWNIAKNTEL